MFGTNKKKDPSKSISMEIESMEKDLAGKGSIKEDIEIDLDKNYSELEKKNLEPVQKPDLDKKMTKMSFGPKKDLQKEEAGGSLSKKFISPEKRINNDYFLHPLPNKEKEFIRDKKTSEPEKDTSFLEEIEKRPTQGSGPDKKPIQSFAGNPFLDKNFDKSTKLKEKETLEEEPASGLNWPILSMIVVTFVVAALSGAYYYFFVLKKTSDVPTQEITAVTEENIPEEEAVVIYPEIETNDGNPSALEESEKIELKEQNIFESIKSIPLEKINIPEGKVFVISENSDTLDASSLINKLNIKLSEQIIANFDKGWLFLKKLEGENIRIGLLLEIKYPGRIDFLKTSILRAEKGLPEAFDTLYLEDQIPIYEPENISFSDSLFYDNFRYFNFYPEKTTPSLDWGIKKYQKDDQANNFVIFSTSRELTKNIIDLLNY